MKLKGRAQMRRNGGVIKADEIIYDPDTDIADLVGNGFDTGTSDVTSVAVSTQADNGGAALGLSLATSIT